MTKHRSGCNFIFMVSWLSANWQKFTAKLRPKVDFVTPARIKLENNALFGAVIFLPLVLSGLLGWFVWQFDPAKSDSLSFFSASSGGLITIAVFVPTAYGIIVSKSALRLNRGRLLRAWPIGIFTFIFGASLLAALSMSLIGATGWQLQPLWLEEHFVKVMLATTMLMALWAGCLMYLTIRQVSSRVSTNYVVLWTLDPKANPEKNRFLITELRDLALTSADVADMNRNDVRDRLRGLASIMVRILKTSDYQLKEHIASEYALAGEHVSSDEILAVDWITYLNLVLKETGIWTQPDNENNYLRPNGVPRLLLDQVIEMSVRCLKTNNTKVAHVVGKQTWNIWLPGMSDEPHRDCSKDFILRTTMLLTGLLKQAKQYPDLETALLYDDLLTNIVGVISQPQNDADAHEVEDLLMTLAKEFGESPRLGYIWGEVVTKANPCLTKMLLKTINPKRLELQPTLRLFDRMDPVFQKPPNDKWILAMQVSLDAIKGIPLEQIPDKATTIISQYYKKGDTTPFLVDTCRGEIGTSIRRSFYNKCAKANWVGNSAFMELIVPLLMSRSQSENYLEQPFKADLLSACWLTHITHYDKQLLSITIKTIATKKFEFISRLIVIAESLEILSTAQLPISFTEPDHDVLYGFDLFMAKETIAHLLAEVIGNPDRLQLLDFEKNILGPVIKFLCKREDHSRNSTIVKSLVDSLRKIEFSRKAKTFVAVFDHFNKFLENSKIEEFGIDIQELYNKHNCFELGEFLSSIPSSFSLNAVDNEKRNKYFEACIKHMWEIESSVGMAQLSYQFLLKNQESFLSNRGLSEKVTAQLNLLCNVIPSWDHSETHIVRGLRNLRYLRRSTHLRQLFSQLDAFMVRVVSPTTNELDVPTDLGVDSSTNAF